MILVKYFVQSRKCSSVYLQQDHRRSKGKDYQSEDCENTYIGTRFLNALESQVRFCKAISGNQRDHRQAVCQCCILKHPTFFSICVDKLCAILSMLRKKTKKLCITAFFEERTNQSAFINGQHYCLKK